MTQKEVPAPEFTKGFQDFYNQMRAVREDAQMPAAIFRKVIVAAGYGADLLKLVQYWMRMEQAENAQEAASTPARLFPRVGDPEPMRALAASEAPKKSKRYKWDTGACAFMATRSGETITLHQYIGGQKVQKITLQIADLPDHIYDLMRYLHKTLWDGRDGYFEYGSQMSDAAIAAILDVAKGPKRR